MTFSRLRPILAAAVLTAVGLCACWVFIARQQSARKAGRVPSPPSLYEARFAPLRSRLGAEAVVGYVTSPMSDGRGGVTFDTRGYYMARYVLSPMRVAWETPCEYAIGDFYDLRFVAAVLDRRGYRIEHDFGNGVMLLKRRTTP